MSSAYNGHQSKVSRRLKYVVKRARRFGLVPTATTDGTHARGSWHYILRGRNTVGHAIDFGFTAADLRRLTPLERRRRLEAFQRSEYNRARRLRFRTYKELLGPLNGLVILQGRPTGLLEGTALETAHDNHVHVAR